MQAYVNNGLRALGRGAVIGAVALATAAPAGGQVVEYGGTKGAWETREYRTPDGKKSCSVDTHSGMAPYDWDNIEKVRVTGKPVIEVIEACEDTATNPTLYTFVIDGKIHMFRYNRGLPIDVVEPDSELLKRHVGESGIRGRIPKGSEQAMEVERRHKATRNAVRNHFVRKW